MASSNLNYVVTIFIIILNIKLEYLSALSFGSRNSITSLSGGSNSGNYGLNNNNYYSPSNTRFPLRMSSLIDPSEFEERDAEDRIGAPVGPLPSVPSTVNFGDYTPQNVKYDLWVVGSGTLGKLDYFTLHVSIVCYYTYHMTVIFSTLSYV